ncbi:hypothetical protein JA1_000035 [Spathaspora sp. JA1]|nr:hypothetical protein JA1_000035 [Spathaspora sp. JA1]
MQEPTLEQINNPKPRHNYHSKLHEEPYYILENHSDSYLKLGDKDIANKLKQVVTIQDNSIVLTNGFYIFITLILVIIIIGGLTFGIREYYLSFKNKVTSSTSEVIKLCNWNESNPTGPNSESTQVTESKIGQSASSKIESGMTQFEDNKTNNENSQYEFNKFEPTTTSLQSDCRFNVIITNKDFTSGFSDKSITKLVHKNIPSTSPVKIVYSLKQLESLNINTTLLSRNKHKQKIPMTKLLSCNITIPRLNFNKAWQATSAIIQAKTMILEHECDQVEKSFTLLKLLSIGKTDELLDNPNLYLKAFNNCIEEFVDSGKVFDIFNDSNSCLQRLSMEMLLSYCWCHFRYFEYNQPKKEVIEEQFKQWEVPTMIQPRGTIFRLLCNLQLGMFSIMHQTSEHELKLGLVIRELIRHSICPDFHEFMAILTQAIGITNFERNKWFFFEILKFLILKHEKCCLFQHLHSIELKTLIQCGINQTQSKIISEKCQEILQVLIQQDETVGNWRNNSPIVEKFFTAPLSQQPQLLTNSGSIPNSWNFGVISTLNSIDSCEVQTTGD